MCTLSIYQVPLGSELWLHRHTHAQTHRHAGTPMQLLNECFRDSVVAVLQLHQVAAKLRAGHLLRLTTWRKGQRQMLQLMLACKQHRNCLHRALVMRLQPR